MGDELTVFRDFLKTHNHKLTHQREALARRILEIDRHFSADELFALLRSEKHGISKATVYRTLALLVEAEVLDALNFERGHMVYERHGKQSHHDHLICTACDRVFEFHCDEIERLQDDIAEGYDFKMSHHTHHIYGLCGRCQSADPEEE